MTTVSTITEVPGLNAFDPNEFLSPTDHEAKFSYAGALGKMQFGEIAFYILGKATKEGTWSPTRFVFNEYIELMSNAGLLVVVETAEENDSAVRCMLTGKALALLCEHCPAE